MKNNYFIQQLTKEQAIIISGYTGILICPFDIFKQNAEKRLNRSLSISEFKNNDIWKFQIKPAFREDFLSLIPFTWGGTRWDNRAEEEKDDNNEFQFNFMS